LVSLGKGVCQKASVCTEHETKPQASTEPCNRILTRDPSVRAVYKT
jgi:hypothetical protein